MKKLLFISFLILCIVNISSCNKDPKPDVDPVNPQVKVTFDTAGGSLIAPFTLKPGECLPDGIIAPPTKVNAEFIGWSLTGDKDDLFVFSEHPINEDIILIAVWHEFTKDYSYFLDEYVPDVITGNINLPQDVNGLKLIWSTSDPITLNYEGICNPDIEDIYLDVNLQVYDNGYNTYYSKPVCVKANEFKELDGDVTFGYYSAWNYLGYPDEITDTVDVVNICFAYVNNDFSLDFSDLTPYITSIMKAHNYGIRVVLSVQGYAEGGKNFSRAASSVNGRKKLAKNMLELVKKYHMDGIDIDWEYPGFGTGTSTSVDRKNYTLFIEELYKTFKGDNERYLVTAAIPGGPYMPSRFDLGNVSKYLDYIHIMTYDMQGGGRATHHSALHPSYGTAGGCSVSESIEYYKNHGVPLSKCVIGIAFYGRKCTASSLGGSASGYKAITYTKIHDEYLSLLHHGVEVYFDKEAQASYILNTITNEFIGYDNEQAIIAKCQYARNMHLGGVMIWELGEDESLTLIKAVRKGMM